MIDFVKKIVERGFLKAYGPIFVEQHKKQNLAPNTEEDTFIILMTNIMKYGHKCVDSIFEMVELPQICKIQTKQFRFPKGWKRGISAPDTLDLQPMTSVIMLGNDEHFLKIIEMTKDIRID